ncbi:MAG: ParB/RepB/Spo0J family partition protein [Ignavibacteria bacterium]|jgi:ParB family chromosome partitioning protein|nr:ParB/RepB/Spo0J family partition protein [Ignavibacteria bacterium]MDH7528135.1 ParB/RepB/Spo0J family partition protein [Ignavibacteria bacterium]
MKSRQVLGKGLGALIPGAVEEDKSKVKNDEVLKDGVISKIPVDKIDPNPYQPRLEFDIQALEELAQSIKQNGVIQPITVHRKNGERFELISGERRLRASILAGLDLIPAYIIEINTKEELIEFSLIENIQRETLNPIEIALGFKRLMEECNLTLEDISKKTGKDKSTISNFIRLLKLPEEIQRSLIKNEITPGHARALINIDDREEQLNLWKKIIAEKFSVREVEKIAKQKKKKNNNQPTITHNLQRDPNLEAILSNLRIKFGTNVKIQIKADGSGEFQIQFYSRDEMERILEILNNVQENSPN